MKEQMDNDGKKRKRQFHQNHNIVDLRHMPIKSNRVIAKISKKDGSEVMNKKLFHDLFKGYNIQFYL